MPAEKTARVQERRRKINRQVQSATRTSVKRAQRLIVLGDAGTAAVAVTNAVSQLDRAARKSVVHPNNAARHKSSLMRALNNVGPSDTTEKKPASRAKSRTTAKATAKPKAAAKTRRSTKSA